MSSSVKKTYTWLRDIILVTNLESEGEMVNMPVIRDNESYLTTQEACDFLHVSRQTINRLVHEGKLHKHKQGVTKFVYYQQSELEKIREMYRLDSGSADERT
jgi:DNA binding domain, excisionase family